MRNSERVLLSVLCFACVVALLFGAFLGLYYGSETLNIMDSGLRRSLAGSLDRIMIGSSHAWNGFMPAVFDSYLHSSSYNLSGGVFPMYAKELFLEKELSRNPLKLVYLEISDDTLTRTNERDYAEGDEIAIARLDSWAERFAYMKRFLTLDDCVNVYSRALLRGVQALASLAQHNSTLDYSARGFYGKNASDVTLTPAEAAARFEQERISPEAYRPENIEQLRAVLQTCQDGGAEPVIVVLPVSDAYLWETAGEDDFRLWLVDFCRAEGCACYDFNLLRDRYSLFSDTDSYVNKTHLSRKGAETFTSVFAELMEKAENGEDIAPYFYGSYEELLRKSPYREETSTWRVA